MFLVYYVRFSNKTRGKSTAFFAYTQIKVREIALLLILVFILQPLIVEDVPEECSVLRLIAERRFVHLTLVRVCYTQASQLANGLELRLMCQHVSAFRRTDVLRPMRV